MKTKQIMPIRKSPCVTRPDPCIRIGLKAFYINSEAMKLFGPAEYVHISLDLEQRLVIVSRSANDDTAFKLSTVNETKDARRIETNRSLLAIVRGGFPLYMLDQQLPVKRLMDGSIAADFTLPVPLKIVVDA